MLLITWHSDYRRASVVCCGKNNFTVETDLLTDFFFQMTDHSPRLTDRLKDFLRVSQFLNHLPVPVPGFRIDELGRCCICVFLRFHAGKQEIQVIRNHQQRLCFFQLFRFFLLPRHKLINTVKNLFLNTGRCIEFFLRHCAINLLIHSFRAVIAISNGISDPLIILVQKDKINCPCINSDTHRDLSKFSAFFHSGQHSFEECLDIPHLLTVPFLHSIRETVNFLENHFPIFHMPENMPSAGCSYINC